MNTERAALERVMPPAVETTARRNSIFLNEAAV